MALSGEEPLAAIGCLLAGGLTGEFLRIEPGVERIGEWFKALHPAVEKARAALEEELATINALPATLLRRAFNGEL
ncbi:MAG: hypothetical protein KJ663_01210 [Proteobacteria bacterium]|nr:hypothetical protein [Pseudomonadota bacterium]